MPSRGSGLYLQGRLGTGFCIQSRLERERLATQSREVQAVDEKISFAVSGGLTRLQTEDSPVLESSGSPSPEAQTPYMNLLRCVLAVLRNLKTACR